MNFFKNFINKNLLIKNQIKQPYKLRRVTGAPSRIVVNNNKDPKKSTILMRGIVAFFLISSTFSLYSNDRLLTQLGLDSDSKYTLTLIDINKRNYNYKNYRKNNKLNLISKNPEEEYKTITFVSKLSNIEKFLVSNFLKKEIGRITVLPPQLNFQKQAMDYYLKERSFHVSDKSIEESLIQASSLELKPDEKQEFLELVETLRHEVDLIIEGLYTLLEGKYSKSFCNRLVYEYCLALKLPLPSFLIPEAPKLFIINFEGDTMCSQLQALREQVDFLLEYMDKSSGDRVIIHLDSPGGTVSSYGQAAFQIKRLRDAGYHVEVSVDQVAASGGYLMSCVANKIYAPSFSLIGSIGVYMSSINFSERLNKEGIYEKNFVAGENKKNYSPFGVVTEESEKKLIKEVEKIHDSFKGFVTKYRPQLKKDEKKICDGSVFLADEALTLGLIDEIKSYEDVINSYIYDGYRVFSIRATEKKKFSDPSFFANFTDAFTSMKSKYTNIMALSNENVSPVEMFKLLFLR